MTELIAALPRGVYDWRPTPGWKFIGDAEEIADHVTRLAEAKGGFVTTDELVADALDTRSPLHPNIELDDAVAAMQWRRHQMRAVVGSLVRVTVTQRDGEEVQIRVRAFPHVVTDGQPAYATVETVMGLSDLRQQYITKLAAEIQNWRRRASEFSEFSTLVAAIDALPLAEMEELNGKESGPAGYHLLTEL